MPDQPLDPTPHRLVLRVQDESGTREAVLQGPVRFDAGRSSDCAVQLHDKKASRRHLEFAFASDGWVVADLGSRNGIQVNGKRSDRVALAVGDVVAAGLSKLTVVSLVGKPAPQPTTGVAPPILAVPSVARPRRRGRIVAWVAAVWAIGLTFAIYRYVRDAQRATDAPPAAVPVAHRSLPVDSPAPEPQDPTPQPAAPALDAPPPVAPPPAAQPDPPALPPDAAQPETPPQAPEAPAEPPPAPGLTDADVERAISAAEPHWHRYRYAEARERLEALKKEAGDKVPPSLDAALANLADEEALFRRFIARLTDPAAKPFEIDLTDEIRAQVSKADATGFQADGASGRVTVAREWAELSPPQFYELFLSRFELTGADRLALVGFLMNHRLDDDAMSLLVRIHKAGGATAAAVDAFLARRLAIDLPPGGFVEAEGRLMTLDEKKTLLARREEQKREAEEEKAALAAAVAGNQAGRIAALVDAAEKKQDFPRARRLLAALAARFPDTDEGRKAKDRLASPVVGVVTLVDNGPVENRFDLVILGDGYTIDELDSFLKEARRISDRLFQEQPFKEYASYFNVRAVCVESKERGYDIIPGKTRKDTALNGAAQYDLMTVDHGAVTRALEGIPNDGLAVVLIHGGGTTGTGGGGVLAMGSSADSILHHETGHALAGLGDEYETKVGAAAIGDSGEGKRDREGFTKVDGKWVRLKELPSVAIAPNLMSGSDPEDMKKNAPWKHWIALGEKNWRPKGMREVGVFEGAGMKSHDVWRPQLDCRMRDASMEYCVVCMEQMVLAFHRGVKGIDTSDPAAESIQADPKEPLRLSLRTMQPKTHDLVVEWTLRKVMVNEQVEAGDTRAAEVPGQKLAGGVGKGKEKNLHFVDLAPGTLTSGVYEVTATSSDPTPYVLLDPDKRMTSTRTWRLEVK